MSPRWAAVPLVAALALAGCGGDDDAAPTSSTTSSSSTSTEPAPTSSTATTEATTTSTTTEAATEPPAEGLPAFGDPWASELVRAWGAGDRDRAAQLATPEVVDQLFGHADPGGDDWTLLSCDSTALELFCTFTSAARSESVVTEQGDGPVGTVRFDVASTDVPPELPTHWSGRGAPATGTRPPATPRRAWSTSSSATPTRAAPPGSARGA